MLKSHPRLLLKNRLFVMMAPVWCIHSSLIWHASPLAPLFSNHLVCASLRLKRRICVKFLFQCVMQLDVRFGLGFENSCSLSTALWWQVLRASVKLMIVRIHHLESANASKISRQFAQYLLRVFSISWATDCHCCCVVSSVDMSYTEGEH